MKNWPTHETTKLFFNKFLFKLEAVNQLSYIFRDKNFVRSKKILDQLQLQHDNNLRLTFSTGLRFNEVREKDFLEAKFLHNNLTLGKDFTLRIHHPRISIYTNDLHFLEKIGKSIEVMQFSKPASFITTDLLKPNTILKNEPFDYEYKLTFKDRVDPSLAKWIENNQDKVKIGSVCLDSIKNNHYVSGFYIYVKNEKILQLMHIMIGSSIGRIDKIVSIDKNG